MIEMHERRPFDWGTSDCVLFAADCVWALTQKDPAAHWRRTYRDEAGARALEERLGGLTALAETSMSEAGIAFARVDPNFAQRGDPCAAENDGVTGLGVVLGGEIAVKNGAGLRRLPLSAARICWAIR